MKKTLLVLFALAATVSQSALAQVPFTTPDNIGAGNCLSLTEQEIMLMWERLQF